MFVNKSAREFYQLFAGILDKKLFLQIVNRDGTLKYEFESKELNTSSEKSLYSDIMDACYDFFDPGHFKFDEDFVLGLKEPFTIRRYGERADFENQCVISCQSLYDLPAMYSTIFLESFLPFEEPDTSHIKLNPIIPEDVFINSWYLKGAVFSTADKSPECE